MDTRGIGPFDNDTAVDALGQVVSSRSELAELWAEAANLVAVAPGRHPLRDVRLTGRELRAAVSERWVFGVAACPAARPPQLVTLHAGA